MTSFRLRIMAQVLPFLLIAPGIALAQAPPTRGEAAAAVNHATNRAMPQYTRQQIDQLVAPIALYPDQLLTQVLMAATYPQQIAEAAQWLQQAGHANLKSEALAAALEPLPWEPSVKALVAFPGVIAMLSEHIEWTQALGVAFATQQADVMMRVQSLRHLAYRSGKLRTFRHLAVREEGSVIIITSAEPDRIFVPVYNPTVVYGAWPYPAYPPVFIPPPPNFVAETLTPGIEVSVGYGIVAPLWGWSRPDWRDRRITINRNEYSRITNNVELAPGNFWQHRGPVVLAAPVTEQRNVRQNVQAPHGTVAPAAAAAVVNLPQRAAAQPTQIRTPSAAERTG
ncbi:MAG TPA: DUF3300 domain-containing protein, partial [Stellaceae bacterium]|nr:DUF3300 domain-containing protein [Stellaceae bacterium]